MEKKISIVLIIVYLITIIYLLVHIYCYIYDIPKTIFENIQTPVKPIPLQNNNIKVWTYWEGKPNIIADICLKSIVNSCKKANEILNNTEEKYEHIHITKDNIDKYLEKNLNDYICYTEDELILKSDLIRLSLLKKYGGIWLDISILVLSPMNQIFEKELKYDHFYAIYNPRNDSSQLPNYPVVETSLLYAPPNHPLIVDWANGMNFIEKCDNDHRVKYSSSQPSFTTIKFLQPSYHYTYYVFRHILINSRGIQNYNNVLLLSDHKKKYMGFIHYNINDILLMSRADFIKKYNVTENVTAIKLCGFDRKTLEQIINSNQYHPESILMTDI